jgi:hypothetical protein
MRGRTVRTPKNEAAFLNALCDGRSVTAACIDAGISRVAAYDWRAADATFAKAWDDAVEEGTDRLEDEAHRRARDGTQKPVYQGGKKVGAINEYSDTLMIFLLKARRRSKFGDKQEVTGADGGPINHKIEADAAFADLVRALESAARTAARNAGSKGEVDQSGET